MVLLDVEHTGKHNCPAEKHDSFITFQYKQPKLYSVTNTDFKAEPKILNLTDVNTAFNTDVKYIKYRAGSRNGFE